MGSNSDSEMYVRFKKKTCDQLGIEYEGYHLGDDATQQEINDCVRAMSKSDKVSGILV